EDVVGYVGSTGGSDSKSLILKLVYGVNLQSVTLPGTVRGGQTLNGLINLTEPFNNSFPGFFPGFQFQISAPNLFQGLTFSGISTGQSSESFTASVLPVDADTPVLLTAT